MFKDATMGIAKFTHLRTKCVRSTCASSFSNREIRNAFRKIAPAAWDISYNGGYFVLIAATMHIVLSNGEDYFREDSI